MLKSSDKRKIESYIQKIIDGLMKDTKDSIASGMSDKQVIERITKATVNKFTPESKMIMSSVYNMMMDDTLASSLFQDPENKTAFYQMDILKDLNSKFVFEVPDKIDFQESKRELENWIKGGSIAVVVIGGVVSIKFRRFIPVGISLAVVLAAIMGMIINNNSKKGSKTDISFLVSEYLNSVQESLLAWIDTIESYYDGQIEQLKKGMNA